MEGQKPECVCMYVCACVCVGGGLSACRGVCVCMCVPEHILKGALSVCRHGCVFHTLKSNFINQDELGRLTLVCVFLYKQN